MLYLLVVAATASTPMEGEDWSAHRWAPWHFLSCSTLLATQCSTVLDVCVALCLHNRRMASEDVQTNLRLPSDLKERLTASATENNRSLSAEVASRLEQTYAPGEAYVTKSQLDRVFERIRSEHDNTLMALGTIRDMLANFTVSLYQRLPEQDRKDPHFVMMNIFAESVKSTDEDQVKKAFRLLFKGISEESEELESNPEKEVEAADYFAAVNQIATAVHRRELQLDGKPLQPRKPKP